MLCGYVLGTYVCQSLKIATISAYALVCLETYKPINIINMPHILYYNRNVRILDILLTLLNNIRGKTLMELILSDGLVYH